MLQWYEGGYNGPDVAGWLGPYCGGLYVDWNLQTNLPRLYAAGYQIFRPGHYAHAATTGRYAGRHAARFAKGATLPEVDAKQVEVERARVYAPLSVRNGMDWKEFNMGVCRVNNYYCVDSNLNLLNIGLKYMDEIWKSEALEVQARNPRELMRVHEVFNIIMNSQMIMEALKAAAVPQKNWLTIKLVGGDVRLDKFPYDFGGDLAANYDAHK